MKTITAAAFAALILSVCAVDKTHSIPGKAVSSRSEAATSTLTKLRAAVKQIEQLADEVDVALSLTEPGKQGDRVGRYLADVNWMPTSVDTYKRFGQRRKAGRRRYDAYGVAGRFGRSVN